MAEIGRTVVVAGNYRCGTTWLAEMLATGLPHYALLFEPIRAYYETMKKAGVIQWRPYITAQNMTPQQYMAFHSVLSGDMCRTETARIARTDCDAVLRSSGLVVKFVRGLMSLRWLADTYKPRHVFVIMRHPCEAVASQLRVKAVQGTPKHMSELREFFRHHPEVERFEPRSGVEWLATYWAASYYVALSTSRPHPWTFVKYEDLVGSGEAVQRQIFDPLGETPPHLDDLVTHPSDQTKRAVGKTWLPQFYGADHDREVWRVVERFPGLAAYYAQ